MEAKLSSQTLLSGMQLHDQRQGTQIKPMKLHLKSQEIFFTLVGTGPFLGKGRGQVVVVQIIGPLRVVKGWVRH